MVSSCNRCKANCGLEVTTSAAAAGASAAKAAEATSVSAAATVSAAKASSATTTTTQHAAGEEPEPATAAATAAASAAVTVGDDEEDDDEDDEAPRKVGVVSLLGLVGLWAGSLDGCREGDVGVGGDDAGDLLQASFKAGTVLAGVELRNHAAADVAYLRVGEDAFETITDFDPAFVVFGGDQHEDAAVGGLGADLPLLFEEVGEVGDGVSAEVVDGDNGDLGVGLVVELAAELLHLGFGGGVDDAGEVGDVGGGFGELVRGFGAREHSREDKQKGRRGSPQGTHTSILRWDGGGGSVWVICILLAGVSMSQEVDGAPVAGREVKRTTIHGVELVDDYAWMRDKGSARVQSYLEAENAYTAKSMRGTEGLQERLYEEILSHIQEDDVSVPYRDGDWEYLIRTEKGKQYARYCRRPVGRSEAEEVFLDVNVLAEGQAFMSVGTLSVSPDGRLLAYTTDATGFRQYTLAVKDLATGELLADTAERVGSIVWAGDSSTLLYSTEDEQTKRQDRVFRLALSGTPVEVFHEDDERFNVDVGRTRDRKYLLLEARSHTTSETWFLSAENVTGEFRLIAGRVDDEEYDVDHRDGFFYLHTNHEAEQFRLMRAPVAYTGRESWTEVLAEKPDAPLEDVDLFRDFLVASYRERGLPVLRVFELGADGLTGEEREIRFADPAYEAEGEVNIAADATTYRYAYQSLVRPASVYEYVVATGESTLLKEQEVPGGFDAANYASERLWFKAGDGTEVPVSLMYRRDKFAKDGASPLYVYGYGSYGYALPLGFRAGKLALLDRGVVVAYAHIRGGGELGDPWHDAGKMMAKRNTFTDFIEAVEFLVREGYADAARVAIEGGSAGGLLMGAVVNIACEQGKPGLFRAVLSHVPFVDVMNTMLDASLPLTVAEYEEWGNPNEAEAFEYMLSYSPYDNLSEGAYPAMLVKTSLNDSQVMYWEPAKYVAKLRTLKTDDAPLLLHVNMDAGHGGASGRYDSLRELAFDDAFLLRELGVDGSIG
jgi:oligopeptidase B